MMTRHKIVLPPLTHEAQLRMLSLPEYQQAATPELLEIAQALPGGMRVYFPGRADIIAFIEGNRDLCATNIGVRLGNTNGNATVHRR